MLFKITSYHSRKAYCVEALWQIRKLLPWVDPLTNCHTATNTHTGAIIQSTLKRWRGCAESQCGSPILEKPLCYSVPHSLTGTRAQTDSATEVSGNATFLICFTNTHVYRCKMHTLTHRWKKKSGQHVQAGQPKPLCPGGGSDYACLCVFNGWWLD